MFLLHRRFHESEEKLKIIRYQGVCAGQDYVRYDKKPPLRYRGYLGRIYKWLYPEAYYIFRTGFAIGRRGELEGVPTNRLLPKPRQNPPMHIIRPVPQPTGTLLKSYLASHPRQQVAPDTPIPESDTSWLNSPTVVRVTVSPSLYVEEPAAPDDTAKQFTGILKLKYYASQTKKQEGA